jgi:predicted nucleic acid-binding protein
MEAMYWDASAVLSLLFPDTYSSAARTCAARDAEHIVSSLTLAEIYAALERARRSHFYSEAIIVESKRRLEHGRWRYVLVSPRRAILQELASKCALKGAGLWHLALVKMLNAERPELRLLSFDASLVEAARGEGFSAT